MNWRLKAYEPTAELMMKASIPVSFNFNVTHCPNNLQVLRHHGICKKST